MRALPGRLAAAFRDSTVAPIALSGLAIQGLMLASGPLVARMLGPEGRGTFALTSVVAALSAQLVLRGYPTAITKTVAHHGGGARRALAGYRTLWVTLVVISGAASGVAIAAVSSNVSAGMVVVTVCGGVTSATTLLLVAGLLGERNFGDVNKLRLGCVAIYVLAVSSIYVVARTDNPAFVMLTYVVAAGSALLWGSRRLRDEETHLDPVARKQVRSIARQSSISGVGAMDSFSLDQLVVGIVVGHAGLGVYAVASSITNLPLLMVFGLAGALLPAMVASPEDATTVMRRWILAAIGLTLAAVAAIQIAIQPAVDILFGAEYAGAIDVGRVLVVAWALLAVRRVLTSAAQAQGKAKIASRIELSGAVALATAAWTGAQIAGVHGAAWGVVLAASFTCAALTTQIEWTTSGRVT